MDAHAVSTEYKALFRALWLPNLEYYPEHMMWVPNPEHYSEHYEFLIKSIIGSTITTTVWSMEW